MPSFFSLFTLRVFSRAGYSSLHRFFRNMQAASIAKVSAMAKSSFSRLLQLVRAKPKTMHSRRARLRPALLELESRLAPATLIWDGGGASNLWSDPFNWNDNVHI